MSKGVIFMPEIDYHIPVCTLWPGAMPSGLKANEHRERSKAKLDGL